MDWQGRVVRTPDTLFDKPRIASTRMGVEFLLGSLAYGWTADDMLRQYPRLKPADLPAMFALPRDGVRHIPVPPSAAGGGADHRARQR